jgi:hypothetical protein
MDQVLAGGQEAPFLHRHIAGHLDHPCCIGMRCQAGHLDSPAAKVDEEQHVIRYQSAQRPDLGGEEVRRYEESMCVRMNFVHVVVVLRSGAGGMP